MSVFVRQETLRIVQVHCRGLADIAQIFGHRRQSSLLDWNRNDEPGDAVSGAFAIGHVAFQAVIA